MKCAKCQKSILRNKWWIGDNAYCEKCFGIIPKNIDPYEAYIVSNIKEMLHSYRHDKIDTPDIIPILEKLIK